MLVRIPRDPHRPPPKAATDTRGVRRAIEQANRNAREGVEEDGRAGRRLLPGPRQRRLRPVRDRHVPVEGPEPRFRCDGRTAENGLRRALRPAQADVGRVSGTLVRIRGPPAGRRGRRGRQRGDGRFPGRVRGRGVRLGALHGRPRAARTRVHLSRDGRRPADRGRVRGRVPLGLGDPAGRGEEGVHHRLHQDGQAGLLRRVRGQGRLPRPTASPSPRGPRAARARRGRGP